MARKASLTHEALVALGPEKLAKLVLDEAGRNGAFKRLVTAALAGAQGPAAIAAIVDRRLLALERARGFIDWDKRKAVVTDLTALVAVMIDELGAADPAAAVARLLRFLAGAERVFERVDDSSGTVQQVYRAAAEALPGVALRLADDEKGQLPNRLMPLLLTDGYGLIERVIALLIPLLPLSALDHFDAALAAAFQEIDLSRSGHRDWERQFRRDRLIQARQAIADQRGDVDAFVALEHQRGTQRQDTLAVAQRFLVAGRAAEALDWVRQSPRPGLRVMSWEDLGDDRPGHDLAELTRARLEVEILEAIGDPAAAQALRWQTFADTLDAAALRDYLAHLPDFAEFDALDRAFAHAAAYPHRYTALAFFLGWPRLDLAAKLVLDQRETWEGRHYGALVPAAEALEEAHPEAATVLYRALIDDILSRARSPAYGHAARYLTRLDSMAEQIKPSSGLSDHAHYRAALSKVHGRKAAFWSLVKGPS
jgi:hypothetical protein